MQDDENIEEQLSGELEELRRRVAELGASEAKLQQVEEALRQRNRELGLLNRASQAFISTHDLDQVLVTVLEEVRHMLGVTACSAWLIDRKTGELVCRQATGPKSEIVRGWHLVPGEGIAGWVARHGESLIVPDITADERHFDGVDQKTGLELRSILCAPLRIKGDVIGVIQVIDSQVNRFDSADLKLIEPLAAAAAIAIENARLYEETDRLRAFSENIVQDMDEGILVEDATGHITFVNPKAAELLGYPPEELIGQHCTAIVVPEQRAKVVEETAKRPQGISSRYELALLTKEGKQVLIMVSARPLFDEVPGQRDSRRFSGVLSVFTDITERKQAEMGLRQRNRQLTLLNHIIAASATSTVPETILETACRELARTFEVPQVAATLLNDEKTEATVVAEHCAEGRLVTLQEIIPVKGDPTLQYLLTHKAPLVIGDAQGDTRLTSIYDLLRERGIVSLLILPIIVEEDVVGSLALEAIEPRHFSAEEVSLAWSVADQVAGALAQIWLNEQRKRLEEQYHQAQKMEAIGRLTAGVAHDFNNLLTAIIGFAKLVEFELRPDDPLRELIDKLLNSSWRAADLVRQLLAFSRKQVIVSQVLDLNTIVANMGKMLQPIIGEDVELRAILAPGLWPVKADPAHIEQVIVNLAVNARDAMPAGGRLTIETANVVLTKDYVATHLESHPGRHVLLTISDTGEGMNQEVQAHLFEPFFTTKESGKGTGLGLATVYGIVKQSGGNIWVYSEEGRGTTFKIYLPCTKEAARPAALPRAMTEAPSGNETILLVEDDASVRELAWRVLQAQGYAVLEAPHGQEALQVATSHLGPIHLLLTDVVMPGISGQVLAEQLIRARPDVRILFMSGYTDNTIVDHGALSPGVDFLPKPFSPSILSSKVRQVLDAPRRGNPASTGG